MRLRAALAGAVALAAAAPAIAAAPAPRVNALVLGKGGVRLAGPVTVTATAGSVAVGSRACPVPAGSALATLAAVHRAGGPSYGVTDDGGCGALYVRRIGGRSATGPEGWVYKVGNRAGTTGAADPSGPFGTGHQIAAGARVTWFWCRVGANGCQRTLALRLSRRTLGPHGKLTVRVRSYDDFAHGKDVKGASVVLGHARARTNAKGRAVLKAPGARGTYRVHATRRGLVPAYPERVEVR